MSFIGYAYRLAADLANAIIPCAEHQVKIDMGSRPAQIEIDTTGPSARMEGGCAVARISNIQSRDLKIKN